MSSPITAGSTRSDSGEPVAELPPLVEPMSEPFGQRPPRRRFLAPVTAKTTPTAPRRRIVVAPAPRLIEPVAVPAEPEAAREPQPKASAFAWRHWLAKARAFALSARRRPLISTGAAVAAILVLAAVGYVSGLGPFGHAHRYPAADAPRDPVQRLAYFQRGAQAGDPDAELQLAILYAKGEGVAQDYASSATWFRAAADQGLARAQYDLGVMYERGRGVKLDLAEAASWYLKSARAGYPLAQYNLAVCYTKGQGLRQDRSEAALWYRRAAMQGVLQAMINLAVVYDKGEGVAASPVDAYAWYLAAGRRGDQASARRAEDVYNGMAKLDQIRAEALASDVANSIRDAASDSGEASAAASGAKP